MSTTRRRMPFRKAVTALLTAVLAVSLLQATPATAAPTPKPSAKAAKAVESCGGALAWHTVVSCREPEAQGTDSYSLPAIDAADRVAIVLTTEASNGWLSGRLLGPGGTVECYAYPGDVPKVCQVPAGQYTLEIQSSTEPGPYTVSVVSVRTASCASLSTSDLSPASAGRTGDLPAGMAADCYQFGATAGDVVRLGAGAERVYLYDTDTNLVCEAQPGSRCDLSGSGPYRALVLRPRANATSYTLRLAKLNAPVGCATMQTAPFGDPGDALVTGTLAAESTNCRSVTLAAGLTWLPSDWQPNTSAGTAELYSQAGVLVCTDRQTSDCRIPSAGVYTVLFDNPANDAPATYTFSAVGRGDTAGCAPAVGTSWDLPPLAVSPASRYQVSCQPIEAAAGDRLKIVSSIDTAPLRVVDAGNTIACELPWSETECTLSGTAPFKIVVEYGAPYQLEIGRLSNAAGCTPLTLTKFGQTGSVASEGSRCRELTVATAATYVIESGLGESDEGSTSGKVAYGVDGMPACTRLASCALQPGRYIILMPHSVHVAAFPTTATDGCLPQGADDLIARRGTFADVSQFDCMTLTAPAGALVKPIEPAGQARTSGHVYDSTGAAVCSWSATDPPCKLTGTAPFRAVIAPYEYGPLAPYSFVMPRVDQPARCGVLPQGDFTTPGGSSLMLKPERFVACLQIPGGSHALTEAIQYNRTAGSGTAGMEVLSDDGSSTCNTSASVSAHRFCLLDKNRPYSVLLTGNDVSSTFQVVRRDVGAGAKGCTAVGSTTVGSTAGTGLIDKNLLRCHKVAGAATDRFAINVRDKNASTRFAVSDSTGLVGCEAYGDVCTVSGATSYQVVTWNEDTVAAPTPYRLETFRVATAAGPAPECTRVANSGYGFGPLAGELSESRTAACVVFAMSNRGRFDGSVTTAGPIPQSGDFGPKGESNCTWFLSGDFMCSGRGTDSGSWLQTALITLPEQPAVSTLKYTVSATCFQPLCGGGKFGVSGLTPASAATGAVAAVTVKGTSLHVKDVVRFTADGKPDLVGVVKSVTADRTTATVSVNLTGVAAGARNLVVDSFSGPSATVANAFTVMPGVTNTKAPALIAPVRVGTAVKVAVGTWSPTATSYTYQWRDNGAAIRGAGAASYTPAAGLLGHKLSVTVTAARAGYASKAVTTAAVVVAAGVAPKASKGPVVTGTYKVGKTVTASAGTWAPACTAVRFQWYSAGKAVAGGTRASLGITAAMGKKALYVAVTCARTGHASGVASTKAVTVAA